MVWGCMAANGVGEMFVCEGRMNSRQYINVLECCLQPSFRRIFGDGDYDEVIFQQDNALCHTSRTTRQWMEENNIRLLDWPAQSPDLNPIEHLWSTLKTRIRNHRIATKDSLKTALREEWNKITAEDCKKLVCSLPNRIDAVIRARGGPTKY